MAKKNQINPQVSQMRVTYQAYCKLDNWKGTKFNNSGEAWEEGLIHKNQFPNTDHLIEVIVTQKIVYSLSE